MGHGGVVIAGRGSVVIAGRGSIVIVWHGSVMIVGVRWWEHRTLNRENPVSNLGQFVSFHVALVHSAL